MTVAEMLERISASELTDWLAYERIAGPLGPERGDVQAAVIASTIANVNRGKRGKIFKPKDFMPQWSRPGARTPDAMRSMLVALTRRFGGKVKTGEGD
jgi:hypothetical protein